MEPPTRMGTARTKGIPDPRSPWEDRFRTPTADELCAAATKHAASLLTAARTQLRSSPDVEESLSWQGLPWRWTLVYRTPRDNGRAWAYLVPDPSKPLIALPLTVEAVAALPMNRLKKHVKDGVTQARMVDRVYWPTWEITSMGQLSEIFDLARHRLPRPVSATKKK